MKQRPEADNEKEESRKMNGGASGFYTTRQADDEYKIRGCQDEDEKPDEKEEDDGKEAA